MTRNGNTFVGLIKELSQQARSFIREEFQLARTEMAEKMSSYGKHTVSIALGGFVAYGGFILFLGGLGALLAFAFQRLGLEPLLAACLGFGTIGLVTATVGAAMLLKGIKSLKKESLAPQKAIQSVQQLKGSEPAPEITPDQKEEKKSRTSEEIEVSVMAIENDMTETLNDLTGRLSFSHARMKAKQDLRLHPYRWGLVALGTGFCGSYLLKRRIGGRR